MHIYVQSTTNPTVRFEVMEYDSASGKARLRGAFGAEFSRSIAKPDLQKYGFTIVKSEKELPLGDSPGLKKVGTIPTPDDPAVEVGKRGKKG